MKSLYELVAPYDSVSLIGMCKNAGKTTTLNQLIAELKRNGVSFGATSVGRDGESTDLVTNTVKPGIFVYKGTIVATAADLLKYCDTTREILCSTGIYTPMGEIIIFRARTDGFVQIAGPSMTSQLAEVSELIRPYGVDKILIDGALGRKSLCSRKVSQSTILCTGASYHKSMATVVRDTAYTCEILQLPQAPFEVPEELWNQNDMKYIPVTDPEHIVLPQERITPENVWRRGAENPPEYMVVQGGLTDAMVKTLIMSNTDLKGKKMVLLDGSKILLSSDMYEKLQIKGLRFEVADALQLLGVTINPFSAYGFHFDKDEFMQKMSAAIDVPVYNVRDEYRKNMGELV